MATDGTADNPRQILVTSVEPIGFYFAGTDLSTGDALSDEQILAMQPQICLVEKTRPQVEPDVSSYTDAAWHLGRKGRRADIEWGSDFEPEAGKTYVAYGRVVGSNQPAFVFAYFKAV